MRTTRLRLAAVTTVLVLGVACSSDPANPGADAPTTSSEAPVATTTEPTEADTTPADSTEALELDLDLEVVGGMSIDDSSARPVFRWDPVDGADRYRLAARATDGTPYWGWEGTDTEVALGGGDPTLATGDDPELAAIGSWIVTAWADGRPIAGARATP